MNHEHRDDTAARLGMWIFLFTEILLFGGLFVLYSVYLHNYEEGFSIASHHLNLTLGTINTLILLTGSFCVASSLSAVRHGRQHLATVLLCCGVATGVIFLFNKYLEWSAEISRGIYPGSPHLTQAEQGEAVFYSLYYVTLGLHGLHVLIGSTLLAVLAVWVHKGKINSERFVALENGGLYWHLVDIIWIFIFPLYYLLL